MTSSVVFNPSDIGLPARLPTASNIVSSSTFATSNRYSRDLHRVGRMLHSILTSRVLLHIRAQAEDSPVWSDGLTELNTIRFHDGGIDS